MTFMTVAQLFTFDGFLGLLFDMNLSIGRVGSALLAPLIVVLAVLSLPFLLRMTVSPAFRGFSMLCSWLWAALWLYITIYLAATGSMVPTVGFTGTLGDLTPGWWAVGVSSMFAFLAVWSSIGLWPAPLRRK